MIIENKIELNRIKQIWSDLAITTKAKEQIADRWIILDESKLRKELRDTTDAKELIEKLGNPPLQDVSEILDILAITEKGDCLTPYQLERVQSILTVLDRLESYLKRGHQFQNSLSYYDESLKTEEELREEIAVQIRGEKVDDHASKLQVALLINQVQEIRYLLNRMA